MSKGTSKKAASKSWRHFRDGRSGSATKSAAGSALSQKKRAKK